MTGAGKSSVAKLLGRTYDPERGTVRVDGLDLRRLDLDVLPGAPRHRAAGRVRVPRDGRVEIAYGHPDAARTRSKPRCRRRRGRRARAARRRARSGRRGGRHQPHHRAAQLVALAARMAHPSRRAGARRSDVGFGRAIERAVIAAVAALGCTTLMVTHREDVVLTADEVVVLSEGRVVQAVPPPSSKAPAATTTTLGHHARRTRRRRLIGLDRRRTVSRRQRRRRAPRRLLACARRSRRPSRSTRRLTGTLSTESRLIAERRGNRILAWLEEDLARKATNDGGAGAHTHVRA